ncbi:unnamed protein product [Cochlearia groenlandica]
MASTNKSVNTNVPEKDVFALHFLQSLSNLNTLNKTKDDRVKKIKKAAYVSMAKAAGGENRLWSKALLRRAAKENNKNIVKLKKKKRVMTWRRRKRRSRRDTEVERLSILVPGGEAMETLKLMEETAHYIKCLSIQVKVMQCLVDGLSHK